MVTRLLGRFALPLVLSAHVAMGIGFGLAMPIFEEYDEASHVLYVRYLQVYRRLPVQGDDGEAARAHHPPGYYLLGALLTAWIPVEDSVDAIQMEPNPNFRIEPGDRDPDNKLRWVHYGPDERFPYSGLTRMVHVLRLLSAAFAALAVWLTYHSARLLRPGDRPFALLAASLLAFNPEVVFQAGLVYTDTAALAAGAVIMYLLTRFHGSGFTARRWALVGTALAAGVLLKLNVLALAVPIGLAWAWQAVADRRWRAWLVNGAALGLPVAGLTGWWFLRNQRLYGDLTANASIVNLWGQVRPAQSGWRHLWDMINDPLGRFGTGEWVSFPAPVYWVASLLIVLGLLSAAWAAVSFAYASGRPAGVWRAIQQHTPAQLSLLHASAIVVVAAAVLYYAASVVGWTASRFLFAGHSSLALILAAGLLAWFTPRSSARLGSRRTLAASALALANLSLAAYALFGLILPTFGPPRAPWPGEVGRMTPLNAAIEPASAVVAYQLSATTLRPGDTLEVKVVWLPRARTPQPMTVFAHLFHPELGSLAQRDSYPGGGNWATTVWDLGRMFVDTYRLHVPTDAPAAESAGVLLGLYDRLTGQRMPVSGSDAVAEEGWIEFGDISIQP